MPSSLSSVAGNLAEVPHNSKCKEYWSCLADIKVTDKLLILKCFKCNKNHKEYFKEDLLERSSKFCAGEILFDFKKSSLSCTETYKLDTGHFLSAQRLA